MTNYDQIFRFCLIHFYKKNRGFFTLREAEIIQLDTFHNGKYLKGAYQNGIGEKRIFLILIAKIIELFQSIRNNF